MNILIFSKQISTVVLYIFYKGFLSKRIYIDEFVRSDLNYKFMDIGFNELGDTNSYL